MNFVCPNCLTEYPVNSDVLEMLDYLYIPDSDEKPFVCGLCGTDFVIDSRFYTYIPTKEIKLTDDVYDAVLYMKLTAATTGAMLAFARHPEWN